MKASKEKRELIKMLVDYLTNYRQRLAFHCNKQKLDDDINYIVEKLKEMD